MSADGTQRKMLDGNSARMLRVILNKSYTATYPPSLKLSILDERDMRFTVGETRMNA